jgi:hypothetical protein
MANASKSFIQVIFFNSSAIFTSSFVVVADLNNKLSDRTQANIIFQFFSVISILFSLYILYKIEQVEHIFSILIFKGDDEEKSIL